MTESLTKERLELAQTLAIAQLCLAKTNPDPSTHRPYVECVEPWEIITEALQTLIDAKTAPTWQPIETAPKDGTRILLYNGNQVCGYWTYYAYGNSFWNHGGIPIPNPTHWMPLPTPPEKSE